MDPTKELYESLGSDLYLTDAVEGIDLAAVDYQTLAAMPRPRKGIPRMHFEILVEHRPRSMTEVSRVDVSVPGHDHFPKTYA